MLAVANRLSFKDLKSFGAVVEGHSRDADVEARHHRRIEQNGRSVLGAAFLLHQAEGFAL
jgi:hypothetical protein